MSDLELRVGDATPDPAEGWRVEWLDRPHGVARLVGPDRSMVALVEGTGQDWTVTIRGRRIPVTVRSWRERMLAEAETEARTHAGPLAVTATLPGLVLSVGVAPGDEVAEGSPLLTIEAMKMQNEVRAPRAGRILEVSVTAGQAVATGAALLRLE
jgi:acetyl/propionyl-CoA carboxylase alpha subunit